MKTQIYAKDLVKEFEVKERKNFLSRKSVIKLKAVDNINLNINEGEIVAFIGPNGAGKSTTIKMFTGIIHPTFGEILIEGLSPIKQRKKLAYKIGCMFGQKSQLYMHLSVIESFTLLGSIYDMSNEEISYQIEYISKLFNIKHLLYRTVKSLSLGQRMICEIAGSIIHNPKIIFLDEPTIGLDVIAKQNVRDVIKKLNKEKNTTIFLTSHDVGDVENICNRLVIINNGKIVKDEKILDLRKQYMNIKDITIYFSSILDSSNILLKLNDVYHENFEVIQDKLYMKVDISKNNIVEVINYFSKLVKIEDIQIKSISMEDIITKIYKEKK